METTQTISAPPPTELCGCPVDCALTENQSYLAIGPGGRGVVLKKMDRDCLVRGSLHPSVHDRLSRVRELAHGGIANLLGVGREGDDAYLMWEYLEGVPFDEWATAENRTPRELAQAARELILTVDLLHMQGIVHGALIGGNVIVSPGGTVRLTHISPLLYTEPHVDADCVQALLEQAVEQRGEQNSALAKILADVRAQNLGLRQLGVQLAALSDTRDAQTQTTEPQPTQAPRRRSLFGAFLVMMLGLAVAYSVYHTVEGGRFEIPESLRLPFHGQGEK